MRRRVCPAVAALVLLLLGGADGWAAADGDADLFDQALQARRVGDFPAAIDALEKLVLRQPDNADALLLLGTLYGFENRLEEAERALRRGLTLAPDYPDMALGLARVLSWRERFAEAEALVDRVLARDPDAIEALTLRGRIAYYRQNYDRAERDFRRAETLAPGTLEALVGLGDVAAARGRPSEARTLWQMAERTDPGSLDVRQRLEALDRPDGPRWRLDLSGGYSSLSDNRPSWREGAVQLTHLLSRWTDVYGRIEGNERFGRSDLFMEVGLAHRLTDALTVTASLGGSPRANFRERFAIGGGLSFRLREPSAAAVDGVGPTVVGLEVRHAIYRDVSSLTLRPALQQGFADGQLTLTAQPIVAWQDGTWRGGWAVRADLEPAGWNGIGLSLGYADAPEVSDGRVAQVSSVTAGVRLPVSDALAFRLDIGEERRRDRGGGPTSRRTSVTLGFGIRF